MTSVTNQRIDASVSKAFFVEMLVRDIQLEMAIHDLLDNCIDGAIRLRGGERLDGLEVSITCTPDYFEIRDNCGGIDYITARDYAFRFGRPRDAQMVPHSVGRFGVGMKRAVFKLGEHFRVDSASDLHRFVVDVDVRAWEEQPEWQFEFAELEALDEPLATEHRGTSVRVDQLFDGVSSRFALDHFVSGLRREIAARHEAYLNRGLAVILNGGSIVGSAVRFVESPNVLRCGMRQNTYDGVLVRQVVGVGPAQPADAGWYVFCNGRMVLRADHSPITGWGEANMDGLPQYHNSYARVRGCVLFDSEDPAALPWNTTKDGVDQDSGLYQTVRLQMVTMMRPVMQFLREAANEQEPEQPLTNMLNAASEVSLAALLQRTPPGLPHRSSVNDFSYIKPARPVEIPRAKRPTRITYDMPTGLVDRVKSSLGVRTNKAVGEETFKYYVGLEVDR